MGKSCPKCSSGIDHDFGVFVCAKCGSVLFVDFDGNVQLSTPETAAGDSSSSGDSSTGSAESSQNEIQNESHIAPAIEDPFPLAAEPIGESDAAESGVDEYSDAVSIEPEAPIINHDFSQDLFQVEDPAAAQTQGDDAQVMQLPVEESPNFSQPDFQRGPPPAVTEVNFEDVIDYANQIELDNTPLVYTLWIEGIDHKEVRDKVIEVLKDIKFNLHLKEIIPTIKGGVLELRDLNPVKTSLIATRLREEAVSFRWKQSVYQSEAASGT